MKATGNVNHSETEYSCLAFSRTMLTSDNFGCLCWMFSSQRRGGKYGTAEKGHFCGKLVISNIAVGGLENEADAVVVENDSIKSRNGDWLLKIEKE